MSTIVEGMDAFLSNGLVKVFLLVLPIASLAFSLVRPRLNHLSKTRHRKKVRDLAVSLSLDVDNRLDGSLIYRCLLWLTYLLAFALIGVTFMIIIIGDLVSNGGTIGLTGAAAALSLSFVLFTAGKIFDRATSSMRNGWHPESRIQAIAEMILSGYRSDWIDEPTRQFVASVLSSVDERLHPQSQQITENPLRADDAEPHHPVSS